MNNQRKLASIQRIIKLEKIPNADAIEKATVLGWELVVKKDQFKEGDLTVYCEVDSFLPISQEFEFLRKNCYKKLETGKEGFRIKTVKLRGQISQGICFPLTILENKKYITDVRENPVYQFNEGDDVTSLLKIEKYEPFIPAHLSGKVKGLFPSFIPKTDEIRIQTVPNVLERHKGKQFYSTEKLDGSSVTFYFNNDVFGVCSRNLELLETPDNTLWKIAREKKIEENLRTLNMNIAIQGEVIGSGIQKNPYKLTNHDVRVFNIFDIDKYRYLDLKQMTELVSKIGLECVPLFGTFTLNHTVNDIIESAKGKSSLSDSLREGLVFRPVIEDRDEELGRLSFKAINPEYLLENEE